MAQALDIERWDLECKFNNLDHHTDLNGVDRLIVRRGQMFNLSLYLRSGSYQPGLSSLDILAETGPHPSEQYGTRASFGLSAKIDTSRWSAAVTSPPGDMVALSVCSAPDAPIGRYTLTLGGSGRIEFILLFNPWCPSDAVYMDNEQSLAEYVLSQDGIIFRGSYKHPIPTPWNFGQFESGILDVCLRLLDVNPKCLNDPGKDCSGRRNPIYVSRVLSAMVNCNDDRGVLLGKWSGGYEGGCWVFAAVACSISRALGIPCRVVTNYLSAHDTNSNLVIERYINENGELIQSRDMIWNYHCWVENWMTRPDLTSDFNGWQATDPTPQEKSEGVYCCGPTPVRAIKEGELTFNLYSSGKNISTKSVGSDAREDITHLYKYPEGSGEERGAFQKANHQNKLLQKQQNQGLHLTIKLSSDMRKGCDFDVFAVVTNDTQSNKKCRLVLGSCAVSYNGFLGGNCGFKDLLNVELSPGAERRVPLRLNYSKYSDKLTEDNLIRVAALVLDYTTEETILAVKNVVLDNPDIKVKIIGEPKMNRKLAAEITLHNPLPETLDNCCFSIEGANLTGGSVITERLGSSVGPGEDAKVKIYFTPSHSGLRKLVVDFDSSKLCHVKGYRNVIIGK
ncbi:unnamed protein product [Pleuronectes platessa]|uniref:Protein-glutamine gamma-glutamyltransferase 2 n=1 Tax=Pleuronectes platessa TaxID=8262 RepID=A0A9N7VXX7_PLEPL|nr:unnamed protein product [Pleuronectes platessa]